MKVFGPVPSRRLGQSLGINNIPPKTCSYSCLYCQIGRTNRMQVMRDEFYTPEDICNEVEEKIKVLNAKGERVDYISLVPEGEPTLDKNLGKLIELLKQFNTRIAIITNASLLWMDEVKKDLLKADWVSLKIDAADRETWLRIDRPHGSLSIENILKGVKDFASNFKGRLVTETMLVKGINDSTKSIGMIGEYIAQIKPSKAYLLVPTRPPAESFVTRPDRERLKKAFAMVRDTACVEVECITEDEGESFFLTDDIINDLLSIISVHPVREDVIERLLKEKKYSMDIIGNLIKQGIVEQFTYENRKFFRKKK